MRPAMHLAAGDDIDARHFLIHNGRLAGSQLCIGKVLWGELAENDEPVERFVPTGHAIGADNGGSVSWIAHDQLKQHSGR